MADNSGLKGLLVYVPSMNWAQERTQELLRRLEAEGWEIRPFEHGIGLFSRFDARDKARELAIRIRHWSGETRDGTARYDRIILVGHSLGGLLLRDALLLDSGAAGEPAMQWTTKVTRVVLLASPNAGYELDRLRPMVRTAARAVSVMGKFLFEQFEEGSEYITELRLRWFSFMASNTRGRRPPEVVQVLGDHDDMISRENIIDAKFLRNATTIEVSDAGHSDLVDVTRAPDPEERYAILRRAILDDLPELREPEEQESPAPRVFILHGIRASKSDDWVEVLKQELHDHADPAWSSAGFTPSYGYFGALHFASPWIRRRNTRLMLRWYGENFVTHNANNLYFVGHSNGTYMLGRSLKNVPSLRFRRIYMAAPVLPRNFDWQRIIERRQVGHWLDGTWVTGEIHSDRGRRDVPVGWLCSLLNGLGSKDIGTGGLDGFDQSLSALSEHRYPGGHGHMLAPRAASPAERSAAMQRRLREVAAFIQAGTGHEVPATTDARWFRYASRVFGAASTPWAIALLVTIIAAKSLEAPLPAVAAGIGLYAVLILIGQF